MELHEEASKILNNPIIVKFFEDAKKNHHRIIESSLFGQDDVRMDSYLMLRAINELETCLKDYVSMGELSRNSVVKRLKSLD